MGETTPGTWPELIPDKWYKCTVNCYWADFPAESCSGGYIDNSSCCLLGADINAWFTANWECKSGFELCLFTGFSAQRLVDIQGPFDTHAACVLEL